MSAQITIPLILWHRLADVIQDMGNHHPQYAGTDAGRDLDVLGNAIKSGISPSPGRTPFSEAVLVAAEAVLAKHGSGNPKLSTIENCIELSERLLGLWVPEPVAK